MGPRGQRAGPGPRTRSLPCSRGPKKSQPQSQFHSDPAVAPARGVREAIEYSRVTANTPSTSAALEIPPPGPAAFSASFPQLSPSSPTAAPVPRALDFLLWGVNFPFSASHPPCFSGGVLSALTHTPHTHTCTHTRTAHAHHTHTHVHQDTHTP